MKTTGLVRRIDDLGRVVIPKELRRTLGIREGDPLELFTEGKFVCFKKYSPSVELSAVLDEVVVLLNEDDMKRCISDEDRTLVKSIVDMLKSKWKETDDE